MNLEFCLSLLSSWDDKTVAALSDVVYGKTIMEGKIVGKVGELVSPRNESRLAQNRVYDHFLSYMEFSRCVLASYMVGAGCSAKLMVQSCHYNVSSRLGQSQRT